MDDTRLKRAGLDYHEYASVQIHESWPACKTALVGHNLFALTTKGSQCYSRNRFQAGDAFVFGPETRGLPPEILEEFDDRHRLRLPMRPNSRSLNLANSAAALLYEAWRQHDFAGAVR